MLETAIFLKTPMFETSMRVIAKNVDSKLNSRSVQLVAWGLTVVGTKLSLISSTPARQTLPLSIQENIGSFAIPAVSILAAGLVSKQLEATGQYYDNGILEAVGREAYKYMFGVIVGLSIGVETGFFQRPELITENGPDMAMGALAISCAGVAARSLRKVVENVGVEIREQLAASDPRAIIG